MERHNGYPMYSRKVTKINDDAILVETMSYESMQVQREKDRLLEVVEKLINEYKDLTNIQNDLLPK